MPRSQPPAFIAHKGAVENQVHLHHIRSPVEAWYGPSQILGPQKIVFKGWNFLIKTTSITWVSIGTPNFQQISRFLHLQLHENHQRSPRLSTPKLPRMKKMGANSNRKHSSSSPTIFQRTAVSFQKSNPVILAGQRTLPYSVPPPEIRPY